jgi:sterol desaturase/sphingolipid hydroxylase (fatty acid hydroxylase superfamily)
MNTSLLDPPALAGVVTSTSPPWPAPDPTGRRRAPRTRRTVALTGTATLAAVASIAIGNTAVGAIAVLFVISWPLERLWRRHPVGVRRLALRTDLAYAVASPALQFVGLVAALVLGVVSLAWLPGLALRPVVGLLPGWLRTATGILLFDLLVYWTHRWSHTVPLFWRFHAIHHSTRHLDWVSGFRAHPLDGAFIAPAFAFALAAGFDPEITGALAVLQFVVGIWAHLNVRWRLRTLRFLVLTPDFHHWHHANEPAAINTNFSTLLPVWDLLFGTFHMPDGPGPQRYGVDDPVPTSIVAQLLHPFRRNGRRTPTRGVPADATAD